jgi:hypothetical protein
MATVFKAHYNCKASRSGLLRRSAVVRDGTFLHRNCPHFFSSCVTPEETVFQWLKRCNGNWITTEFGTV